VIALRLLKATPRRDCGLAQSIPLNPARIQNAPRPSARRRICVADGMSGTDDRDSSTRPVRPRLFLVFLGALIGLGPFTVDAYLPALPTMAETFGVAIDTVNYTISLYLIGFGVGQFFGGALSDQVGRKTVGIAGLGLYVLASLGIAAADSIGVVLALRIVQALGGGCATVVSLAAIRDMYSPSEAGEKFATVMLIMLLAPLLAPAGGALLLTISWRAIFAGMAAYALLLILWYATSIPETRAGSRQQISLPSTFRQCYEVISRRVEGRLVPIRYALAMALGASVLMVFITNASFVYIEYFGFSPGAFPFLFGASALALMAANLTSMKLLRRIDPRLMFRAGCAVQWIAIAALFAISYLGRPTIYLVVPLIMLGVGSVGLINPAGNAVYMGYFRRLSGSAASVFTTSMFCIGSALGALTSVWFDGSLVPMTAMMLLATTSSNLLAQSVFRRPLPERN
jgi:DHA1 family bicyclomycin/chloramphenicol resistance-like MFS transporter